MIRRLSHAAILALVGLLVFAAACAKKLTELEPYPCAEDGTCPDGRSCNAERRCVRAEIDSLCRAGETDCTTAAAGGRCALGVCGQPCDGVRLTCPDGRVCTVGVGAGGEGACLRPCDDANACPAHLTCRQLDVRDGKVIRACVSPTEKSSLGATCKSTEDCIAQGAALECIAGICTLPCKVQSDCGAGFRCPVGGGGCLRDCTTDETVCDDDQACKPLWSAGLRVCTGKDSGVSACESVRGLFVCGGMCGQLVNKTVECSSGKCPTGASCGSNPTCACPNARSCGEGGHACNSATPCSDNWWCEPSLTNIGCGDDISRAIAGCICRDGRRLVSPCGSSRTCEQRCQDECDVLAQDCSDPDKPKCANVSDAQGEHDRCVALASSPKKEGDACSRTDPNAVGIDDCDKGLFCSRVRAEEGKQPELRCTRYCQPDVACPNGQICILSRGTIDERSDLAACRTRCTFPNGTECGPGARCSMLGGCISVDGTHQLGEFCRIESDCKSPLVCDLARNRCVPLCGPGDTCPDEYACQKGSSGTNDAGAGDAGAEGGAPATNALCVKKE